MSLYLGNLSPEVDLEVLTELCTQLAPVKHVRIHYKPQQPQAKFAFAEFCTFEDAEYVYKILNEVPIKLFNRPLRVNWGKNTSQKQPLFKVFIGNLVSETTDRFLKQVFSKFGTVKNVDVYTNLAKNKSHAIVSFDKQESADRAINELNGYYLSGNIIKVEYMQKV